MTEPAPPQKKPKRKYTRRAAGAAPPSGKKRGRPPTTPVERASIRMMTDMGFGSTDIARAVGRSIQLIHIIKEEDPAGYQEQLDKLHREGAENWSNIRAFAQKLLLHKMGKIVFEADNCSLRDLTSLANTAQANEQLLRGLVTQRTENKTLNLTMNVSAELEGTGNSGLKQAKAIGDVQKMLDRVRQVDSPEGAENFLEGVLLPQPQDQPEKEKSAIHVQPEPPDTHRPPAAE